MSAICPECDSDIDIDEIGRRNRRRADLLGVRRAAPRSPATRRSNSKLADDDDPMTTTTKTTTTTTKTTTTTTKTTTRTTRTRTKTATPTRTDALARQGGAPRRHPRRDSESVIVAFSGGVDSAYLAVTAAAVLGARALAVTADSASYPDTHRQLALRVAREFAPAHEIIDTAELHAARVPRQLRPTAATTARTSSTRSWPRSRARAASPHVVDGSNADDRGDYRPGRQAAREHGVRSPLDEADLTKADIRQLARGRHAHLGRARVGLPVVAHSLRQRSDRREAAPDRARRGRGARPRVPRVPRAPPRHAWPDSRLRATRWRARSSPSSASASSRALKALGYQYREPRPAGLPSGQPQRGAAAAPRIVTAVRARWPRWRWWSAWRTCRFWPRRSKTSTR